MGSAYLVVGGGRDYIVRDIDQPRQQARCCNDVSFDQFDSLLGAIMSDHHLARCTSVATAIKTIWASLGPDGVAYGVRLARLASVIAHANSGQQGAGLTAGVQQESLFKDMLFYADRRFRPASAETTIDADYVFDGYPLSHKTIGATGSGDLALAWSKNPAGGVQRNHFAASMVVMSFRAPSNRGKWVGLDTGAYVIPADYLQATVVLSSNNKTDSLISSRYVTQAMRHARDIGCMVPLVYHHSISVGVRLSLWQSGAGNDIPPLPPVSTD
jgi:hypothetical protein